MSSMHKKRPAVPHSSAESEIRQLDVGRRMERRTSSTFVGLSVGTISTF